MTYNSREAINILQAFQPKPLETIQKNNGKDYVTFKALRG